jgi:hypothetical protein
MTRKSAATRFVFGIALVTILAIAGHGVAFAQQGPDTETPAGSRIYMPLAQIGPSGCGSAGGTGAPIWTYVTGQGIDVWLNGRCPAHQHVWIRVWYSGPSCLQGYCQTSWAWMTEDWVIIPKVVTVEATNEIHINEFVEFVSVMNIPFSLDVYPWPPAEDPQ